jgi:hypothetical protein
VAQVSQKHFNPEPVRQSGFAADSVFVAVEVELESTIGNAAMRAPALGGQSKLVFPFGSNG